MIRQAEAQGLVPDYHSTSKNLIRFTCTKWDIFPFQKEGRGWTKSNRILLFELSAEPPDIVLMLTVGPGDRPTQHAIHDAFVPYSITGFTENRPRDEKGWAQIIQQPILRVEAGSINDGITEAIQSFWTHFLAVDLPVIQAAIAANLSPSI